MKVVENKVGRPRLARIDEALLMAAEDLLLEEGFHALTIQAVTERSKITRPTFYRRYPGMPALLLDLMRTRFGQQLIVPDTGSLFEDLLYVQREQVALFADPLVQRGLGGFLVALQEDDELRDVFIGDFFQPRRNAAKDVIARGVLRGEITAPSDLEAVCDKLMGPLVVRTLFPSLGSVDELLAHWTATDTVQGLLAESNLP